MFVNVHNVINIITDFKLCKSGSDCTYFQKLMPVSIYNSLSVLYSLFSNLIQIYLYVFNRTFIQLRHLVLAIILPPSGVLQLAILLKIGKETLVSEGAWQFRFPEIIFQVILSDWYCYNILQYSTTSTERSTGSEKQLRHYI